MFNRKSRLRRGLTVAVLAVGLLLSSAACDSPPEALGKSAEALPDDIKNQRKDIDRAQADYIKRLETEKYAFLRPYSIEENHHNRFDQARTKLNEAESAYGSRVKPVTDNYKNTRKGELETGVAAVNTLRDEAKALTAEPAQWSDKVVAVKADPDGTLRQAATLVKDNKAVYDPVKTEVEKVKAIYTTNGDGINRAFQPITDKQAAVIKANGLLQTEAGKSPPNYAVMTQYFEDVKSTTTAFQKDAAALKGKLGELKIRETHTLLDIRVDSVVIITRTTWNEAYDWPDEHDHEYEAAADLATTDYFAQFGPDTVLAEDCQGWGCGGGFKTKNVDRAQWDKLKIDPRNPSWHSDDTNAEFSFDEIEDTYCHKLKVLIDGKPDTSKRPDPAQNYCSKYDNPSELEQGIYWAEADDLDAEAIGMDIYSKGAGDFTEQATDAAAPPGMVYVGDPTTGEWQTDSNGNQFWAFYGQYMFFSQLIGGPSPYHYGYEHNDWKKSYRYSNTPYYGSYGGGPRYGAKSPLFSARFPQSNFATSGLHTSTLRNSGPAARAGGPGGGK